MLKHARSTFRFLPPANEVAERLCFQLCLPISQLFCPQGTGSHVTMGLTAQGHPPPCSQKLAPHCTETPSAPALPPRHVETCSNWTSLYRESPPPYSAPNMFNLVHCEKCAVGKRAVCMLLECFLVASIPVCFGCI